MKNYEARQPKRPISVSRTSGRGLWSMLLDNNVNCAGSDADEALIITEYQG